MLLTPFDPLAVPLSGTNLIEASAGTGKTYSIAALFVRLILEKRLTPEQILVVTFTNAATDELKDRIRQKITDTQTALQGKAPLDPFLTGLAAHISDPPIARQRLQHALMNFDCAAVFTIHGFCQRILSEYAFEAGDFFESELVAEPSALRQQAVNDFWRCHVAPSPPEFFAEAPEGIASPQFFWPYIQYLHHFELQIQPSAGPSDFSTLQDHRRLLQLLRKAWSGCREEIIYLLETAVLNARSYGSSTQTAAGGVSQRTRTVAALADAMDRFLDPVGLGVPLFKGFEKFTETTLKKYTLKHAQPPVHSFFELCDRFLSAARALAEECKHHLLFLKKSFFSFFPAMMDRQKQSRQIQFFEDLLERVHQNLAGPGGEALAKRIRRKYLAALVDEFQDTDPLQYEIFRRLFGRGDSVLFMIGDPKQAIYGFRGADIFSYMRAARAAENRYTLARNWRSTPGLVKAVNTLFSNASEPFVFSEIPFAAAEAAAAEMPEDDPDPALVVWRLIETNSTSKITKARAEMRVKTAVAREILRLTMPEGASAACSPGDIAVLVRTHRQAQAMKECLSAHQISAVIYSAGNVFETHDAQEMERVLNAIASADFVLLKSALATDILGVDATALTPEREADILPAYVRRFREYAALWHHYGFMPMFRAFMRRERVRERILQYGDGERRLTNLLHLAEILNRVSIEKKLGENAVLKWFEAQRQSPEERSEANQLRLESDENAVTIVTIHKSKGLEYPVVFCPFAWENAVRNEREVLFHDPGDNDRLTLDLAAETHERHRLLAQTECLAENLRLFYVALTRACRRCYLAWGRINSAETSAMAYLFHGHRCSTAIQNPIQQLQDMWPALSEDDLNADLETLGARSGGTLAWQPLPPESADPRHRQKSAPTTVLIGPKQCRVLSRCWRISSYSALVSQKAGTGPLEADQPDRDGFRVQPILENPMNAPQKTVVLADFPKGAAAGLFFHSLLEEIDFTADLKTVLPVLIRRKLSAYGYDPGWRTAVWQMTADLLHAPLHPQLTELRLCRIPPADCRREMEFHFPLKHITPSILTGIVKASFRRRLPHHEPPELNFEAVEGFLKGYIDLVFHWQGRYFVVDWKSNDLGPAPEDYRSERLEAVIVRENYVLQYQLYAMALHRYLSVRLKDYRYETHFGGVFYIFLRGVTGCGESTWGVYFDRLEASEMQALEDALINPAAQRRKGR